MNVSHIIHEFSFGPFFPAISQPLDLSLETTDRRGCPRAVSAELAAFTMFQYFLRVVPTTYIDASRRRLSTSQYAVTDYSRTFEHGEGVPGIFFKYDLEGMSLTIEERTTSLYQFLIRLVGVIGELRDEAMLIPGGVWTVAGFGLRFFNRAHRHVVKAAGREQPLMPSISPGQRDGVSYFGGRW